MTYKKLIKGVTMGLGQYKLGRWRAGRKSGKIFFISFEFWSHRICQLLFEKESHDCGDVVWWLWYHRCLYMSKCIELYTKVQFFINRLHLNKAVWKEGRKQASKQASYNCFPPSKGYILYNTTSPNPGVSRQIYFQSRTLC